MYRATPLSSYLVVCFMLLASLTLIPDAFSAPGPKGCYDPVDFGAIPDDGIDDRAPAPNRRSMPHRLQADGCVLDQDTGG